MQRLQRLPRVSPGALLLPTLIAAGDVALAVDNVWFGPDLGNWNTGANWSVGAPPDGTFNEAAVINNGTRVELNGHAKSGFPGSDVNVAGVRLGSTAGSAGELRIVSGGNLPNVPASGESGAVAVGIAGQGNLTILSNGKISAPSLSLGGAAGSSISLADTASLMLTGAAELGRTTTIIGPNVNFSAGGNLTLDSASTLIGDIRHATLHSPLRSQGTATVNGTFRPIFTGVTPALGSTWILIDASTITGTFASLDTSAAPALPAGQSYRLIQADGGSNGKLLQLSVGGPAWNVNSSGNWSLGSNWTGGVEPNGVDATADFDSVIDAPRIVTADAPRTVGVMTFNNDNGYTIAGPGALTMEVINGSAAINIFSGSHTISTPVVLADNTTVTVSPASSTLAITGSISAAGQAITKAGAGTAQFSNVRAAILDIDGGMAQILPDGGPDGVSRVNGLTVSVGGRLDLSDNKLIATGEELGSWNGSAYTDITGFIDAGRGAAGNAAWDGSGIVTSDTRAINNGDLVSIGVATGGQLNRSSFGGLSVAPSDVLAMVTWGGDANLDGKINIDDYGRIDGSVGQSGTVFGWFNGDFNYDGKINIDDYAIIDGNINRQGAAFATGGISLKSSTAAFGELGGAVPEPSIQTLLSASLTCLTKRYRRVL